MKNTILFTPSAEQLIEIAKQDPELNLRIKDEIILSLEKSAVKFINAKIKLRAEQVYKSVYSKIEGKIFRSSNYWENKSEKLNLDLESFFSEQIEKKIRTDLQKEFEAMFESDEFKNILKLKVKEKVLASILSNLDTKIQEETRKLIA